MSSNNFAVVIKEPGEAAEVLARLRRMADDGRKFRQFRFDPEHDSFPIIGGRDSNMPPLPVVEECGIVMDGAAARESWDASDHGLDAVDLEWAVGCYHETDGIGYMTVPQTEHQRLRAVRPRMPQRWSLRSKGSRPRNRRHDARNFASDFMAKRAKGWSQSGRAGGAGTGGANLFHGTRQPSPSKIWTMASCASRSTGRPTS